MARIDMRKHEYGKCAAALKGNFNSSGAEAMYDQALTNGLLAIVAAEWHGSERSRNRTLSAADLLKVIQANSTEIRPGVYELTSTVVSNPSTPSNITRGFSTGATCGQTFQVEIAVLQDGIDRTQVTRHGRLVTLNTALGLEQAHIDALCALDAHPALDAIPEGERDRSWFEAKVFDLWSRSSAEEYLELIGEAEADRRAGLAGDHSPAPGDAGGPYIHNCPICLRDAFIARSEDDMANGVGIGTCLVCAYDRSEIIAQDEALEIEWEMRWADQ